MISPRDWGLIGLPTRPRLGEPARAAAPMHQSADIFPGRDASPRQGLRVGLGCSLHHGRLGAMIAEFHTRAPDVELSLADIDEPRAAEALLAEAMDAAILLPAAVPLGLRSAPLCREPLVAILPANHPLAHAGRVEAMALRHETILMAGDARGDIGLQQAIVRALGGPPTVFGRYAVERDTLLDLVALNLGVAIVPGLPAESAHHPGVRFRALSSPAAQAEYRLLWKPSNRNPAFHAFAGLARGFARGRKAEGGGE